MKQVVLDTSFILSCVKQKIDFIEKIDNEGIQIIIPEQTIDELMGLGSQTALNILGKSRFELVKVPGKDADAAIIKIAKQNPEAIIATLDQGLQKKLKNRKMIIRGKKKLDII